MSNLEDQLANSEVQELKVHRSLSNDTVLTCCIGCTAWRTKRGKGLSREVDGVREGLAESWIVLFNCVMADAAWLGTKNSGGQANMYFTLSTPLRFSTPGSEVKYCHWEKRQENGKHLKACMEGPGTNDRSGVMCCSAQCNCQVVMQHVNKPDDERIRILTAEAILMIVNVHTAAMYKFSQAICCWLPKLQTWGGKTLSWAGRQRPDAGGVSS